MLKPCDRGYDPFMDPNPAAINLIFGGGYMVCPNGYGNHIQIGGLCTVCGESSIEAAANQPEAGANAGT